MNFLTSSSLVWVRSHAFLHNLHARRPVVFVQESADVVPPLRRGKVHNVVTRHALDAEVPLVRRNFLAERLCKQRIADLVLHSRVAKTFVARIARTFGKVATVVDESLVIRAVGIDVITRNVKSTHAFINGIAIAAWEVGILGIQVVGVVPQEIGLEALHEYSLGALHALPLLREGMAEIFDAGIFFDLLF